MNNINGGKNVIQVIFSFMIGSNWRKLNDEFYDKHFFHLLYFDL